MKILIVLFGTDIEKNFRHNNALNEPEWHKIPKEPKNMENWVVPWPEKMYGSFYNIDSFIKLHIVKFNNFLDYTAYMWVEKQSTKDETRSAVY